MICINWEINNNITLDEGLYFGKGVFETILIRNKAVFLEEHINRLQEGASLLKINNTVSIKEVENFLKKKKIRNCSLKIILTDKNIIAITRDITYTMDIYKRGFKLKISNVRRNSTSIMPYIKSINYIENIIERNKAIEEGFDEVLFLNENNFITEGSISNIYFIKNNKIKTATVNLGLLDGTVRKWLMKNFEVEEGEFTLEDLKESECIFLTNSLVGIIKVSEFEGKKFNENIFLDKIISEYLEFLKGF